MREECTGPYRRQYCRESIGPYGRQNLRESIGPYGRQYCREFIGSYGRQYYRDPWGPTAGNTVGIYASPADVCFSYRSVNFEVKRSLLKPYTYPLTQGGAAFGGRGVSQCLTLVQLKC